MSAAGTEAPGAGGNKVADFTTGSGGVPAVVNNSELDRSPPELTGATVTSSGVAIELAFDEDLDLPATIPAALKDAFSVTAAGDTVEISGLAADGSSGLQINLSSRILKDQAVVVSYDESAAGTNSLDDDAGNEVADFTTGSGGVPAVGNDSTELSDDATLSELIFSVRNLASTALEAVDLSPAFDPGMEMYSVSVSEDYTQVTFMPAVNHADATVAYFDGVDMALEDASTGTSGHQVNIAVGPNTVKVKVTAPDGTTEKTYTVTVTRDRPTLSVATVQAAGTSVVLQWQSPFPTGLGTLSAAAVAAFTVTADGVERQITGIVQEILDNILNVSLSTPIYQGQAVVVSYDSAAAGAAALVSATGHEYLSFTTGEAGVPAAVNNSTVLRTAPGKPTGVMATAFGGAQIDLSWTAPSDGGSAITGYRIEVSTDGGTNWTDLVANTRTTGTKYTHTGLAAGSTRHYRVSAINAVGTSAASDVVSDTTATTCTLNTGDKWCGVVTVGNRNSELYGFIPAFLALPAVGGLSDKTFDSYTIDGAWTGTGANAGKLFFDLTSALSAADKARLVLHVEGRSDGLAFSAATGPSVFNAYDWGGTGLDWSSDPYVTLRLRLGVPGQPTNLAAEASGTTQIDLTWDAPGSGGSAITGYRIEVSENGGTDWDDLVADTGNADTSYSHTGLSPGDTRHYRVSAINAGGRSEASGTADATTIDPPTLSSAEVPAILGGSAVNLHFSENLHGLPTAVPASIEAAFTLTADGVEVEFSDIRSSNKILQFLGVTIYQGQTVVVSYDKSVAGTDAIADSDGDEVASFTTGEDGVPAVVNNSTVTPSSASVLAPSNLTATAGDAQVMLAWDAPASDSGVTRHEYRFKTDGSFSDWMPIANSAPGEANEASFTVTGLENGTAHTFHLRTANADTNSVAVAAMAVTPTVPPGPAAPTNFMAVAGELQVALTWDAPASGSGVTRHEYQYKTRGEYLDDWKQIADSAPGEANEASFTVTGLTGGTAHTFELRAVSAAGNSAAVEKGPVTPSATLTPPTIDSVAVTSTPLLTSPGGSTPDTYGRGETIEVSVIFNEAVTATTGTDFVLSVAGRKRAPLLRGSGTATLVFGYTVLAGDRDTDGIWMGDQDKTLVGNRNGEPQTGAITSVATTLAADLTHGELGTQSGHKVDGSRRVVSADATLSALVVNDGRSEVTLSPSFAPGTTGYTALVANAVAQVTVTPTTTHAAATVAWLDGSDMTLADAGTAAGQQVTLAEGANVIKVKVTAEDTTTTETYTVTVTRRAADAPGDEGDLRLTDEKPYTSRPDGTVVVGVEGRVEIFHAKSWGTVCDDGFSRETTSRFIVKLDDDGNATDDVTVNESANDAPALVCQSMGYDNGEYASGYGRSGESQPSGPGITIYYPENSTYEGIPQPIWLDELTCAAGDAALRVDALPAPLAHCAYAGWGLHNCSHREDAGVRCWNEPESAQAGARALKARFVSPPEHHDGSGRVRVRVAFSEAIDESPENVGEHGVKVEGGRVTSVRRVDNQSGGGAAARSAGRSGGGQEDGPEDGERVWEFEIEPGSDDDLTMRIDAGRPCDEPGAICTADGRSLSEGIATTVEGPDPVPLTAELQGLPEAHDGEDAFHFRVAFSEDISIGFRSMGDDSFTVDGGEVTRARRVDRRHDLWRITVEPDGEGDVTVTLPAGRECAISGAICTGGENRRQLSNTPTATVAGPVDESESAALTASFVEAPHEHDGETAFKLRIAFSEGISIGFRTFRDQSLSVSGGSVTKAKRVDRSQGPVGGDDQAGFAWRRDCDARGRARLRHRRGGVHRRRPGAVGDDLDDGAGTGGALGGGCAGARRHGRDHRLHGEPEPGVVGHGDGRLCDRRRDGDGGVGLHGAAGHADLRAGRHVEDGGGGGAGRCGGRGRGDTDVPARERDGRGDRGRHGDGHDRQLRPVAEDVAVALRAHGGVPRGGRGDRSPVGAFRRIAGDAGRTEYRLLGGAAGRDRRRPADSCRGAGRGARGRGR